MRSMLLHINDDRALSSRMQVALDLARAFDGHLTCLQSDAVQIGAAGNVYGGFALQYIPEIREGADKLRAETEATLAREGIPWDYFEQDGFARQGISTLALLNDLIVLGACNDTDGTPGYSGLVADVVMHAQTPVMLVPEGPSSFDVNAPIVVAWNGSPEACHALRDALPLLRCAKDVCLLSVEEETREKEFPSTAAARYLARHGIEAELAIEPLLKGGIAPTLQHAAMKKGASCIVMGAYGHSRFRELVLGGVSRAMMSNPQLPIMLSH